MTLQLKAQTPDHPNKPADLAQRVRSLMAQTDNEQKEFTSEQDMDVTQSMFFLPSQDTPSPSSNPQVTTKPRNGSFDNLEIPYIDEEDQI